jgi:hypothetical protein
MAIAGTKHPKPMAFIMVRNLEDTFLELMSGQV